MIRYIGIQNNNSVRKLNFHNSFKGEYLFELQDNSGEYKDSTKRAYNTNYLNDIAELELIHNIDDNSDIQFHSSGVIQLGNGNDVITYNFDTDSIKKTVLIGAEMTPEKKRHDIRTILTINTKNAPGLETKIKAAVEHLSILAEIMQSLRSKF